MMYRIHENKTYKIDEDEQMIPLANFTAEITKEIRTLDGLNSHTTLTIQGLQPQEPGPSGEPRPPRKLPELTIDANEFAGFQWVLRAWGTTCVIYPGTGVKDDLRTAIQLSSRPTVKTIFATMGWQQDQKGHAMYLHAGGAIRADGNDPTVIVSLPTELKRFNLADGQPGCDPHEAFHASLNLLSLGPPEIFWPMWAATYAPVLGPIDFALHLAGRSGTFKSEISSLFQAHFGATFDARHLPASWSSTANALEAQSFFAANAIMVTDDFVPIGTSHQVKAYQTNADRLIRGQGNQSGRARLSDAASFKSAYYPRGMIFSTGEDTPDGHSIRARMIMLEISPGDTTTANLSKAQAERTKLPVVMSAFIADACDSISPYTTDNGLVLREDITARINELRDELLSIGHARTPPMIARLITTVETVLGWALSRDFITESQYESLTEQAVNAIVTAGEKQAAYLTTADPVQVIQNAIRISLQSLKSHIRSMSGGVPIKPESLGWTATSSSGEQTKYKANGPTIGWIDWDDDTLYLEGDLAYGAAKKEAGNDLTITKQTAWKRLKDAGCLKRTDASRSRNTVRVHADGHSRNVLALCASDFFDTKEREDNGDSEERDEEQ